MSRVIDIVVSFYTLGLIAYTLLSWLRSSQTDRARAWLGKFYDPLLSKIRTAVKPVSFGTGLVDLSPMILLVGLMLLKTLILRVLPRGW